MKNKTRKIAILIVIIYFFMIPHVNAGIIGTGEAWLEAGKTGTVHTNMNSKAQNAFSDLAGLLFAIGVVVALIVVAILGIKFMTAGAYSDMKASVKKNAIIVAIGIFVLFGSLFIWKIIVGVLSGTT